MRCDIIPATKSVIFYGGSALNMQLQVCVVFVKSTVNHFTSMEWKYNARTSVSLHF